MEFLTLSLGFPELLIRYNARMRSRPERRFPNRLWVRDKDNANMVALRPR